MGETTCAPDLKACPFCGSTAAYEHKAEDYGYAPPFVRVGCTSCFAYTPWEEASKLVRGKGHIDTTAQAKSVVAAMWNKRVTP